MYSFDSRIRYSEVDEEKYLTINGIINYFQDCSTFQSEDIGLGLSYLEPQNRVWVLNFWQIIIDRYPKLCEKVTIATWPYEFNGFIGYRNFVMYDEQKNMIAKANSIWAYLDTKTGRFAKAEEEMVARYGKEERLDMDYADRKIKLPAQMEAKEPVIIRKNQIDTNHHVNNEEYVEMASEYVPNKRPKEIRVEYKKSALLNDAIYPYYAKEGQTTTVLLADEQKKPYATVMMIH